jgi:hypothetical protein
MSKHSPVVDPECSAPAGAPMTADVGDIPQTGEAPPAIMQRLAALSDSSHDRRAPRGEKSNRRVWWIVAACLAGATLFSLFVMIVWRLHGPQFVLLKDGWYHVTDREWGFEFDLPGWYSKRQDPWGGKGVRYATRVPNDHFYFDLYVTNWQKTTMTAAAELMTIVEYDRAQAKVRILEDRSKDLTDPMIEFETTIGNNSYTVRRRVTIHKDRVLDMRINGVEGVTKEDLKRAFNSFHWTR